MNRFLPLVGGWCVPLIGLPVMGQETDWVPAPEPVIWRSLRDTHLPERIGVLSKRCGLDRAEAAEYLRRPRAVNDTVELEAGLLLRRAGQEAWTSRVLAMRAVCPEGRMERKDENGEWTPYPGRPGTVVKVRWICSLP